MNKRNLFPIVLIVFMFGLFVAFTAENKTNKPITTPDNVKAIIENSCFGCHNTDSKNDKAKKKLDLNTIDTLPTSKMIHILKEISEVIEENDMPPAKFLEKFPDKKLTDDQRKILIDWADSQSKSLMK